MKKLFVIAVLIVGLSSFAQEKKANHKKEVGVEKMTPEQRTEKHLKKLTAELKLNPAQAEQVKQLMTEQASKREANKLNRDEIKANAVKPSKDERQASKENRLAEKEAMESKMKTILTSDQYAKWQTIQEKNKDKKRNKKEK